MDINIKIIHIFNFLFISFILALCGQTITAQGISYLAKVRGNGGDTSIVWKSFSGTEITLLNPELIDPNSEEIQPFNLKPRLIVVNNIEAKCNYDITFQDINSVINGTLEIILSIPEFASSNKDLLICKARMNFDKPIEIDVMVKFSFELKNTITSKVYLPERTGYLRTYNLAPEVCIAGKFELGERTTKRAKCNLLGLPVIGIKTDKKSNFAFSMDPFCGGIIQAESGYKHTIASVITTYAGSIVPLKYEERTIAMEFYENGSDRMLQSFYNTIPEIKSGAAWIHDIHLVYYDYLSDDGEGWFKGLKLLAEKIPEEYRGSVAVCLHGWYDYIPKYAFDVKINKFIDEWVAFPLTRKTPMSIKDMHRRIKFSKDLGFRTLLYFADGTNTDSEAPDFREEYVYKNKEGKTLSGWQGPDTKGKTFRMDPSVKGVSDFYKYYLKALLEEFGKEVDGFVWDETFYIPVNSVSYSQKTPTYADREMMKLVAELTKLVQSYHYLNPDLVFLASDAEIGIACYAIVSHGTYQDSGMDPNGWGRGMFMNYRNCLWSCNWFPISHKERNKYAAEILGLPQGLSNGWGDDQGPHEMPQEELNSVIQRFLKNVTEKRQRTKFFDIETR